MNIAFDLDGCIADFITSFIKNVKIMFGATILPEFIFKYELDKCTNLISKDQIQEAIEFTLHNQTDIQPYPGSVTFIRNIYKHLSSKPILVITSRNKEFLKETYKWWECFVGVDVNILSTKNKLQCLIDNSIDIYIEDNPSTFFPHIIDNISNELYTKNPYEFLILMPKHPWNTYISNMNTTNYILEFQNWDVLNKIFSMFYLNGV